MIEGFEVIRKEQHMVNWKDYIYKFKFEMTTFYSYYAVSSDGLYLLIEERYCNDKELSEVFHTFSFQEYEKMKKIILNQKEIRLRHLINSYRIVPWR